METTLNQVTVCPDGTLEVRIRKSDGGWHRTTVVPGVDPAEQMAAVNAHLEKMGVVPCNSFGWLTACAEQVHTPQAVDAFQTAVAAAEKAREA